MLVLVAILRYAIPDKPLNLITQLSRERQLAKETMYSFEKDKRRKSTAANGNPLHLMDTLNNLGLHQRVCNIMKFDIYHIFRKSQPKIIDLIVVKT